MSSEVNVRFGRRGLSVRALTFRPSASFVFVNALASCSFENVSVARACARFPTRSFDSQDTYQVPAVFLGARVSLHFASLSAHQDNDNIPRCENSQGPEKTDTDTQKQAAGSHYFPFAFSPSLDDPAGSRPYLGLSALM